MFFRTKKSVSVGGDSLISGRTGPSMAWSHVPERGRGCMAARGRGRGGDGRGRGTWSGCGEEGVVVGREPQGERVLLTREEEGEEARGKRRDKSMGKGSMGAQEEEEGSPPSSHKDSEEE